MPLSAALALLLVPLASAAAAAPPNRLGHAIARAANPVWRTPMWANDGTGAMPIGNGDVTGMVWVDDTSGDLRLVLGKSDAFDENSMKVQVGALRLKFDPPLWEEQAPAPAPHSNGSCTGPGALRSFQQVNGTANSTIGDQHSMIRSFPGWKGAPEAAAELCCNTSRCVAFSQDATWGLELFSDTATDVTGTPGGHWRTWVTRHPKPAPVPPPPPFPRVHKQPARCLWSVSKR